MIECVKAPAGWKCTRAAGHDGPCAAVELNGIDLNDWPTRDSDLQDWRDGKWYGQPNREQTMWMARRIAELEQKLANEEIDHKAELETKEKLIDAANSTGWDLRLKLDAKTLECGRLRDALEGLRSSCIASDDGPVLQCPLYEAFSEADNALAFSAETRAAGHVDESHIGQTVQVNHERYRGTGILSHIYRPVPSMAGVTLEHGGERYYEVETVTPSPSQPHSEAR